MFAVPVRATYAATISVTLDEYTATPLTTRRPSIQGNNLSLPLGLIRPQDVRCIPADKRMRGGDIESSIPGDYR